MLRERPWQENSTIEHNWQQNIMFDSGGTKVKVFFCTWKTLPR